MQGQAKQRQARRGQRQRQARRRQRQRQARTARNIWTRTGTRTRARIRLNVGIVENVDTAQKNCWSKKNAKGGSKGKHKPKNADAHNLDSKPSIVEPDVEIDEFSMTYRNVDALQQESEKCEVLNGSRLESTQVQERRHGLRVSRTERRFLVTVISLSHSKWRTCQRWQTSACCGLRRLEIESQSSRCSSTSVQTIVVCWRVHNDGWCHCAAW